MKTLLRLLILPILAGMTTSLSAQTTLEGKVLDANGEPLGFANVLLLNPTDSSLVKGALSRDDGAFRLDAEAGQRFLLSAGLVGYPTVYSEPFVVGSDAVQTLPDLVLSEGVELAEVQVVARKPLFEQKIDRMVVNVANSVTAAGGTALEVLERSPGVIVNRQNNGLSLVGKTGVVIMINGKITYQPASGIVQMLEGMSADNIERIELITTPPAKYDAEGDAGYINIVLKKRTDQGLNGNFALSGGVGEGNVSSGNLNLNFRQNRLNVFGTYSFFRRNQRQEFYNFRRVTFQGLTTESEVLTDRDPIQRNHNLRLGMDYELSDKTIIGALVAAYDNKWTMDAENTGNTREENSLVSELTLLNTERNQWKHFMANVNIQHEFAPGTKLNFDVDYLLYEDENPNTYLTSNFDSQGQLTSVEDTRSDKYTPIDIAVAQLAFEKQLNDKLKYEGGVKAVNSQFTNEVSVERFQNEEWIFDPQFTDRGELAENIFAAYSSVDYQADENNAFKFGLRYEYTDSELNTTKEGKVVDRQFGSFFPTIFYSHTIDENQGVNVSLNRRITRPTFNDMAPFAIFLDPNTFFFGDVALQPAISNNAKVDYRYKSYLFSIQYTYEDSTIARFQDEVVVETNQQAFSPDNMRYTHSVAGTLTLPFYVGNFWEMQNNVIVVWQEISSLYNGTPVKLQNTNVNLNTNQTFKLPSDFTLEVNAFYQSAGIFGRSTYDPVYGVGAGIQKKLPNDWGNLRFGVTDIFNSIVFRGGTSLPELGFVTDGYFDFSNRTFRLSYSRNFGNNKLKASRRRGTGSEEERQRVN